MGWFSALFKQFDFLHQNLDLPNDALHNNTKDSTDRASKDFFWLHKVRMRSACLVCLMGEQLSRSGLAVV